MTGPTSVERWSGEPVDQFGECAFQHGEDAVGHVFLHAEHTQGRAALAGAVEGGHQHVADDLLGQSRGVHDHGVLAAGFGDQRDRLSVRFRRSASWRWISRATSVEPVNITAWVCGDRDQRAPISPAPGRS